MAAAVVDTVRGSCSLTASAAHALTGWKYKTDRSRYLTGTVPVAVLVGAGAVAGTSWSHPYKIAAE